MDNTAQSTAQLPQQPVSSNVPSSVSQISIGREQGPIQVKTDNEDETPSTQQYVPAPKTQEHARAQSPEVLRPSTPDVIVPVEIDHVVERSVDDKQFDTSLASPAVKQYVEPVGSGVPVPKNDFGIQSLPLTHEQADVLEKKTGIKSGSHWFADKVKYLWEKINPTLHK